MKDKHKDGSGRHSTHPHNHSEQHGEGRHRHHRSERHGSRRGSRLFDYGELRLLILAMISKEPRHGYELIKLIEERFSGSYTPSPGVIYPTLAWLEDMGYARVEAEESGRKRYSSTSEGEAFLLANRAAADALLSRAGPDQTEGAGNVPTPVIRAMENLKVALRLRFRQSVIDKEAAEAIAGALDAAVKTIERS